MDEDTQPIRPRHAARVTVLDRMVAPFRALVEREDGRHRTLPDGTVPADWHTFRHGPEWYRLRVNTDVRKTDG